MKTEFTQDWKDWITTNIKAGQDPDGIFKILIDEGYGFDSIAAQMNYRPSRPVDELVNPYDQQRAQGRAAVSRNNNGLAINPADIITPNAVIISPDKLDLRVVDDFLSADECEKITAQIKTKLRPSSVANFDIDSSVRTSRTCDLGRLNDDFITQIDERICQLVGINAAYGEVLQGQYYEVGQEFKAHTDYFEPHEYGTHCRVHGQRTYTVMVYLNDVERGGETRFRRAGAEFKPKTGQAIIWNSLNPDGTPNMHTLHQAKPVEAGYKAVITKWFRTTCPQADSVPMMLRGNAR